MAYLEFLDPSSSVYPFYGLHGGIAESYDWDVQTTKWRIQNRLDNLDWMKNWLQMKIPT